jgi:GNAT superfamily N-acetyltransferase
VSGIRFPHGFRLETLRREHPRRSFRSGEESVDQWLATRALQNQEKHLSVTRALLDIEGGIAGYYTLATGQVDFSDLPAEVVRHLPRRKLPVAVIAWLGVSKNHQGQGLGGLLLAQALRNCHEAGRTFAFVAVILDCINDKAKAFYRKWDFEELPGSPYRLFVSTKQLDAMMQVP